MTIFPCSRCGEVPEFFYDDKKSLTRETARIVHHCAKGRAQRLKFTDFTEIDASLGVIYLWNEANAGYNPNWWPERYDYLHTLCKSSREDEQ